jgi:15-cis-phytoene synthase
MAQAPRIDGFPAVSREVRDAAMLGEPDRYLAATLAPVQVRADLAAIAAFAAELGRIPSVVSEPMLGDIRLQWWREALERGREGHRSGHPVADSIIDAQLRHGFSPEVLLAMIDARELDLAGGMPQDDAGLAAYLHATQGHPFRLALGVLGAGAEQADTLARTAGEAYGIARLTGRLAMLIHNGGVILPAERLQAAGMDPALLAADPLPPGCEAAVRQVCDALEVRARAALAQLRSRWLEIDRTWRVALLPLAMVEPYFKAQSGRQSVLDMRDVSPFARVVRIGMARLAGRV